jgi:hypothetical protein
MSKIEITTKLWKRSKESWGTTIPKVVLQGLDLDKKYKVKWEFDRAKAKWFVGFEEIRIISNKSGFQKKL